MDLYSHFSIFAINTFKICKSLRFFSKNYCYKSFKFPRQMKTLETVNKLKDTIIFINEDFSRAAMDITKKLWEREWKSWKRTESMLFSNMTFFQIWPTKVNLTYLSIRYSLTIILKFSVYDQIRPLISKI